MYGVCVFGAEKKVSNDQCKGDNLHFSSFGKKSLNVSRSVMLFLGDLFKSV